MKTFELAERTNADAAIDALLPVMQAAEGMQPARIQEDADGGRMRYCVDKFTSTTGEGTVCRFVYEKDGQKWARRVCAADAQYEHDWRKVMVT